MSSRILQLARQDVERGDHWLARQRLASHLSTCGYDPEVLSELGQICLAMHDANAAGKYWLASPVSGAKVDDAVQTFVSHAGTSPAQIASALPPAVRRAAIDALPDAARQRIAALGLENAILEARRRKSARLDVSNARNSNRVGIVLFVIVVAMFVTGVFTVVRGIVRFFC